MTRSLFVELFGDDRMDYVLVQVEPGADPDVVRAALVARWGEEYQLSVFTNADLRRDILQRIDRAFLRYVWRYPVATRPVLLAQLREHAEGKTVVFVHGRRQARGLVDDVRRLKSRGRVNPCG